MIERPNGGCADAPGFDDAVRLHRVVHAINRLIAPVGGSSDIEEPLMTKSLSPLFIKAVIDCVSEARSPSIREWLHVAQRIWSDGAPDRSAIAWTRLPADSVERLFALRAARLALCGNA